MESLLQLHLQSDSEKAEAVNLPRQEPEREEPKPLVPGKRLHQMMSRAAHKAATEFSRSGSGGIFSK